MNPLIKKMLMFGLIPCLTHLQLLIADELIFGYEADELPLLDAPNWPLFDPCEDECSESVVGGHLVHQWRQAGDRVGYHHWIAQPPDSPPISLWVEWQFRSNHPIGPFFDSCDAYFLIDFQSINDLVYIYGDAAISFSGDYWVNGLELDALHTFRFESVNGVNYWISVDGIVFVNATDNQSNGYHYIEFVGKSGCTGDQIPNARNEWDFVRYGTIGFGERIVAAVPPMGFLNPNEHANLDRFTVTYDSPNYAYIDDITVRVTCATAPNCPQAPRVIATKRLDNGPPDVLEVRLDRPLPANARTVFTFTDVDPANPNEPTINTVSYTFQLGDVNADGQWNLADFASMQNCFYQLADTNTCAAFDFTSDAFVDLGDYAVFRENAFP